MSDLENAISSLIRAFKPGSSKPRSRSQSLHDEKQEIRPRSRSRSVPPSTVRPLSPEIKVMNKGYGTDFDFDQEYVTEEELDLDQGPLSTINKVTKTIAKKKNISSRKGRGRQDRGRARSRSVVRSISRSLSRSRSRSKQPTQYSNIDKEELDKLRELVETLTKRINSVTLDTGMDKTVRDSTIGSMTEECLHIQALGPDNLENTIGINPTKLTNAFKFARQSNLKYEPRTGMREFIATAQASFDNWRLNPMEYMTILTGLLPPQFGKALRSLDQKNLTIPEFYSRLMSVAGEGELLAERKKRFYNTSCSDATDLLDLVTKLESLATNIFSDDERNKEIFEQLKAVLPLKYREDLQRALQYSNRGKHSSKDYTYPAPLEILKILYPSTSEINKFIKNERQENVKGNPRIKNLQDDRQDIKQNGYTGQVKTGLKCHNCQRQGHSEINCWKNKYCLLCGSVSHKAVECKLYRGETVVQEACKECKEIYGRNLLHASSVCKTKKYFLGRQ